MPSTKNMSKKDKSKMSRVYAICTAEKKKYKLSEKKFESCIMALKKKFAVGK